MGRKRKYFTEEEKLEAKKKARREYNHRNKEKVNLYNKKWYSENKGKKHEYYKNNKKPLSKEEKIKKKEYMVVYREDNKEVLREYRLMNKEKLAKNNEKWLKNNREIAREKSRRWRKNNPNKTRESNRVRQLKRKKNDPLFRLSCNVRSMLCKVIQRQGFKKNTRSHNILGCDFDTFKKHIENQLEDWMTWDNYGLYNGQEKYGWDIDHITPISVATTEDEVLKLNHHKNLQPLCSKINRDIKSNKKDF